MTEIDLGDELAHFDEPSSDPRQKPEQPAHPLAPGGGAYMSLADLQAAGFNTTPPPGFSARGPNWRLISASGGGGQPGGGGSSGSWPGGNGGATFIPPSSPYHYTIGNGDSDD